jgi:hypothetical protein
MAKYIILNGKVYNIKWPKKLYYFDKTLIAKNIHPAFGARQS